jgi:hypothetical protein
MGDELPSLPGRKAQHVCDKEVIVFFADKHLPNPYDPCPSLSWRWDRAGYLLQHRRHPLPQDDAVTGQAWEFRRALARCRDDDDRRQLAGDAPAIYRAHEVFASADSLGRAELEGRLLGGSSDEEVAAPCGLSPATVGLYADVFFDVRPKLSCEWYIFGHVLGGGRIHSALDPQDQPLLVKLFGYSGGGLMVDVMLDYVRNPPAVPADLGALDLPALKRLHTKLRLKQLILMMATPASALPPAQWWAMQPAPAAQPPAPISGEDQASLLASVEQTLTAVATLSEAVRGSRAA